MRAVKLLICDIDNTLFDWSGYYASAFRALVHVAARELAIPEERLYSELKVIHQKHRSIEYSFSLQELPSTEDLDIDALRKVLDAAIGAFNSVKRKRLRPFQDVRRTLTWIRMQQYTVVAVTNSPTYQAYRKLERMGLRSYFDGLVSREGWGAKGRDDPLVGHRMPESTAIELPWHVAVSHAALKPSTIPYELVLERYPKLRGAAWVVGDSLSNDIAPANQLGLHSVWARYGSTTRAKDLETLLRVTDWTDSQLRALRTAPTVKPEYSIDTFSDLQGILPESQPTLFDSMEEA